MASAHRQKRPLKLAELIFLGAIAIPSFFALYNIGRRYTGTQVPLPLVSRTLHGEDVEVRRPHKARSRTATTKHRTVSPRPQRWPCRRSMRLHSEELPRRRSRPDILPPTLLLL